MFLEFGYVLVFVILSVTTFSLHIPKEKGIESYKKARFAIGGALGILSLYSIISFILPLHHTAYLDFWLLVTFTLIHSWLTYSAMLFLLETPRFRARHFLIDGIAPISIMLFCGFLGLVFPAAQKWMQGAFGFIFALKCAYMFYACLREYNLCKKEMNNFYDNNEDIRWIKGLIFLSLFMSIVTVIAFYEASIDLIYYLSIPVIYAFIVFKVINFAPRRIDAIRKQNDAQEKPVAEKKRRKDIEEKIGPLVSEWVKEKKFCTPDLSIKDVAAEIGTNHNYLSQYLNNNLNISFQTWLNTLRIEESKILLTDGEKKSIEEVGTLVGIPQIYNFSRWFRIVTGTTPFQYRKHN